MRRACSSSAAPTESQEVSEQRITSADESLITLASLPGARSHNKHSRAAHVSAAKRRRRDKKRHGGPHPRLRRRRSLVGVAGIIVDQNKSFHYDASLEDALAALAFCALVTLVLRQQERHGLAAFASW